MVQDQQTYRRAGNAALLGLCVQLLLSAVMAVVGLWAQSPALHAATWHFLGGLPLWMVVWLIYKQHQIERAETFEVEQLSRSNAQTAALFETQADELRIARKRLDNLYHWGLHGVSLGLAVYLLTVGITLLVLQYQFIGSAWFVTRALGDRADANPGLLMAFMAGIAFIAFIVGRYAAGMTVQKEWQLLRGGAGYLMGLVLLAILILAGAAFALFANHAIMAWMGLIVPGFMALLGLEIILSFLSGAYRPRKPGEIPRPAFDSRLLGWLTKPESLAKIINETINYQFGFEISRSWFYLLMSRSITPLLASGLAILSLFSAIVIVEPHQQAVITRFGAMQSDPVGPGIHFKLPWPMGGVQRYDTGRVQVARVGSYQKIKEETAILWTNQHVVGKEEYLITAPTVRAQERNDAGNTMASLAAGTTPAVSLVAAEVQVHYLITDLRKYVQFTQNPDQLVAAISDRAVTQYFVSKDLDTLIGKGRLEAGDALRQAIQQQADQMHLGVEVQYVGIVGVHPPRGGDEGGDGVQVAAAFHEQIGAIQEKETTIWKAKQERIQTLAQVAGSEEMALQIRDAVLALENWRQQLEQAKTKPTAEVGTQLVELSAAVAAQEAQIEALLVAAPGQASQLIYEARAQRWETGIAERSKAQAFPALVAAYRQAPNYFQERAYLDALAEGLVKPRKYIVAKDALTPAVHRIDLKDATSTLEGFLQPGR